MNTFLVLHRYNENLEEFDGLGGIKTYEPSDIPDDCFLIIVKSFLSYARDIKEPEAFQTIRDKYNTYSGTGFSDLWCINKKYNFKIYVTYFFSDFYELLPVIHGVKHTPQFTTNQMKNNISNDGPCIIVAVVAVDSCDYIDVNLLFNFVDLLPYINNRSAVCGSVSNSCDSVSNLCGCSIMSIKGARVKRAEHKK